jgi:peptide/nickel transport system ATP-binding protein
VARVLDITDLSTHIKQSRTTIQAVGNVDLRLDAGETLGLVGESGCGKSMTGLSIMSLLPPGGSGEEAKGEVTGIKVMKSRKEKRE